MKTAAEIANAILSWQSVQRTDAQWTKLDMTPLSALIQQYRDAVLEEAAVACDRRFQYMYEALGGHRSSIEADGGVEIEEDAKTIRALKGCA